MHFVIKITRNLVSVTQRPPQMPFGMRHLHMDIVTHSPVKSNSQAAAFLTPSGFSWGAGREFPLSTGAEQTLNSSW